MLPTHRVSPGRTRRRRSHHALRKPNTLACPNCGATKLPHRACLACGYVRPGLKIALKQREG